MSKRRSLIALGVDVLAFLLITSNLEDVCPCCRRTVAWHLRRA